MKSPVLGILGEFTDEDDSMPSDLVREVGISIDKMEE